MMKLIQIHELTPGMIVGREVFSESGVPLLQKGSCLTEAKIENLYNWGIYSLYILDAADHATSSVVNGIPDKEAFVKKYTQTVAAIKTIFENARHYKQLPIFEIRELADTMISPLTNASGVINYLYEMHAHCDSIFSHSVNVAVVSGILGKWLYRAEQRELILAGLLHDIGKIFVPLPILNKPDKLSDGEFAAIKEHALAGFRYVRESGEIPEGAKLGVLQHHERIDGSGYPKGLPGEAIHDFAKIVAVADIYEAMTADRPYRGRLTPFAAVESIVEQMHDRLDPGICMTFLCRIRDHLLGSKVMLSNGQQAVIIVIPHRDWTKPVVRTGDGKLLDLQKENIRIVDCLDH